MEYLVNGKRFKDLKEAQDYELKIEEEAKAKEKLEKEKQERLNEITKLIKEFNDDYKEPFIYEMGNEKSLDEVLDNLFRKYFR